MTQDNDTKGSSEVTKPMNTIVLLFFMIITSGFFILILFPIAQDWSWMEAWVFIFLFTLIETINIFVLNKKNPEVIRNRLQAKKQSMSSPASSDKIILPLLALTTTTTFILPSLNHRFQWNFVPAYIKIIGFGLISIGLILVYRTMFDNAYASKVLDVRKGQHVIDTGTYAYIRHPMYSGYSLLFIGTALGLGDWYSVIPGFLSGVIMYIRTIYEEKMLLEELPGYTEYMKKVKKRFIPFIL